MNDVSRLFPVDDDDDGSQPQRAPSTSRPLFDANDTDESTAAPGTAPINTDALSTLFAAGESADTEHADVVASPSVARGYPPRRIARNKVIGLGIAAVAVAAIGVGAYLFVNHSADDGLGALREDERVVFALEKDVISKLSSAGDSTNVTDTVVTTVLEQGETLRGVVSDATLDSLAQSGQAVTAAFDELDALEPPAAYQRDLPDDPDAAAIATAREELETRKADLETKVAAIETARDTLSMRVEGFGLMVERVTAELLRVSEAQLAVTPALENEEAITTLTVVLTELRAYEAVDLNGPDAFTPVELWTSVGDATRVFIDERARLAAEAKAKQEAEQESTEEPNNGWRPPATGPGTQPPATTPTTPPATQPPVTNPPTNPPATDPPTTDPPETDPPVTNPPATDPPANEAP